VAGALDGRAERWRAMAVTTMAAWAASVHKDIFYNAIVKAFAEEESNVLTKKKKGSAKKGRWCNILDYSNHGLTAPYKVLLEKVVYQQNTEGNCFNIYFLTTLHVAGYKTSDGMKLQVVELVNQTSSTTLQKMVGCHKH
jgi:hypothetical protein